MAQGFYDTIQMTWLHQAAIKLISCLPKPTRRILLLKDKVADRRVNLQHPKPQNKLSATKSVNHFFFSERIHELGIYSFDSDN